MNRISILFPQGGLPMYVASRGLYNLEPPKIFVPPSIKEDVEKLLEIHRTMGQVELNVELIPLDVGMDVAKSFDSFFLFTVKNQPCLDSKSGFFVGGR